MLLVDSTKFELRDALEIHRHGGLKGNFTNPADASEPGALRARSPLAVKLAFKSKRSNLLGDRQSLGQRRSRPAD
jgi:hypothetical protein